MSDVARSAESTVGVVGAGYVGLATAACLAHFGFRVVCVDSDAAKVQRLRAGSIDIQEPRMTELIRSGAADGRLEFCSDITALSCSSTVMLCLPTPPTASGDADLTAVHDVAEILARHLRPGSVLVVKSTVPVGTCADLADRLAEHGISVASNPEFLREGTAINDFLEPARVVVGAGNDRTAAQVACLYTRIDAPIVCTDPASAELAKYASNAFLAMKTSYVNELGALCERVGADIDEVAHAVGMDPRIGPGNLRAGPGWGGSCLPKDTRALAAIARRHGVRMPVLSATIRSNALQHHRVVGAVRRAVGPDRLAGARIAVLGITFKAGTDDTRESPALDVAHLLTEHGADVVACDPSVVEPIESTADALIALYDDPYAASAGADVIVVLTEWPQFTALDWSRIADGMRERRCVDARGLLDGKSMRGAGFRYVRTGVAAPGNPERIRAVRVPSGFGSG
ncbi:UDP-glucose dehydrogenase family protein [Tomitella gaofuii]|uniref:UDP-glucose dehydrogenase family protein n=1 Tax=Tomitella gaofuii TaxID=2760083 RepID=UPI0015F9868D|nr:UDP-glucose/GDP-mannose dehydrogenase family protein [Tomitella gaofuii]